MGAGEVVQAQRPLRLRPLRRHYTSARVGEMAERSIALVLKTSDG